VLILEGSGGRQHVLNHCNGIHCSLIVLPPVGLSKKSCHGPFVKSRTYVKSEMHLTNHLSILIFPVTCNGLLSARDTVGQHRA
jgi:hypothetical protein